VTYDVRKYDCRYHSGELVFQVILDLRVRKEFRDVWVQLEVLEVQALPVSLVSLVLRVHLVRRVVPATLDRQDHLDHKASLDSPETPDFPGHRDSSGQKVNRASWVTLVVRELRAFLEQQVLLVQLVPLEVQARLALLVLMVLLVRICSLYLLYMHSIV